MAGVVDNIDGLCLKGGDGEPGAEDKKSFYT